MPREQKMEEQKRNDKGQEIITSVGMTVTLISFSMLFATLMMGLAMLRFSSPVWPPQGMSRPVLLPTISTITILLSSISLISFQRSEGQKIKLLLTILLGVSFLFVQTLLWRHLKTQGIYASSGIFASIIYGFTWIHAAHIVLGLLLLLWLYFLGLRAPELKAKLHTRNVSKFWHFLGIVWVILYVSIFLL